MAAQELPPDAASGGYSPVTVLRLLILVAFLVAEHGRVGVFPDQGSNSCLLHWQVDS